MKILLVAVNAKYIHSNPAVYDLKAYAEASFEQVPGDCLFFGDSLLNEILSMDTDCESSNSRCSLKENLSENKNNPRIEIAEYTINNRVEACLADIYNRQPDVVAFSCYIWNWAFIKVILKDIKKVLPDVTLWLGGPEVSYHAEDVLAEFPMVEGIMIGEGEATFSDLCGFYHKFFGAKCNFNSYSKTVDVEPASEKNTDKKFNGNQACALSKTAVSPDDYFLELSSIPGLCIKSKGKPYFTGTREPIDLNALPFWYKGLGCPGTSSADKEPSAKNDCTTFPNNLDPFKNRIVYYESSRGCPFNCSYCLSSVDTFVRYRSLDLVLPELKFFLDSRVPQVKFIDRTFNCNHKRTEIIWKYITENDNGITNFHFEISADLLNDAEIELLSKMRPGLVQLEIGVQTTNPKTLKAIHRNTGLTRLQQVVAQIKSHKNVHVHLDLIAGLPYEDYESFKNSFKDVFLMKPDQFQLGFLKVLKGSPIESEAGTYEIKYLTEPPYEVLSTKWLSYGDVLKLKAVEEMLETFYNSHQFERTIAYLLRLFENPFDLFEKLAEFYEVNGYNVNTPSRMDRFNVLLDFAINTDPDSQDIYKEFLTYDAYLRENCKSRPTFAVDLSDYNDIIYPIQKGKRLHVDVFNYSVWDGADAKKLNKPEFIGFDYENKNPISGNYRTWILGDK